MNRKSCIFLSVLLVLTGISTCPGSPKSPKIRFKSAPFKDVSPLPIPLNLTMPDDYIQIQRDAYSEHKVFFYAAESDAANIAPSGDSSRAKKGLIKIYVTGEYYYDETRNKCAF